MRLIIVIPAEFVSAANTAAAQLDSGGAGELTFTVPLYAAGQPQTVPAAYWCSAEMSADRAAQVTALGTQFTGCVVEEWNQSTHPARPAALLAELGLERERRVMPMV